MSEAIILNSSRSFSEIYPDDLSDIIIVGDPLTSDIQGGLKAGIKTYWYNPEKSTYPEQYRVDYQISDLHELPDLLDTIAESS